MYIILVILILSIIISTIFERKITLLIRSIRKLIGKEFIKDFTIDENGIPLINIGAIDNKYYGEQYHPVMICHQTLDMVDALDKHRDQFLTNSYWLVDNILKSNGYFLQYHYPYKSYDMIPPWHSAMAQGRALEVLTHAHRLTKDEKFINSAINILSSLKIDINKGGTTIKTKDKGWWFEEYPAKTNEHPKVLNGMMYTLRGLIVYYEHTKDSDAKFLIDKGIFALESGLPDYDKNGVSYYNALGKIAGGDYHQLHIKQLNFLYNFTKSDIILHYQRKWKQFQNQTFLLRLIKKPFKINCGIFALSLIISIIITLTINMICN